MEKIAIIFPAHNEEERIGRTLQEYSTYFNRFKQKGQLDYELVVVLNGCQDKSLQIVTKLKAMMPELKILDYLESGKGFALIQGFKEALKTDCELIGFADADMSVAPAAFHSLILNLNEFDGIIASRWQKESVIQVRQSSFRILASRIFNVLVRVLLNLPYRDTQCGAKIFKAAVLAKIIDDLSVLDWAFDIDILYKLQHKGFTVKEFPTTWKDQSGSKVNLFKASCQMLYSLIKLKVIYSQLLVAEGE